jgi:hypothetical protein
LDLEPCVVGSVDHTREFEHILNEWVQGVDVSGGALLNEFVNANQ